MNGFINVLKPPGMTSHDVVGYLRRLFSRKEIGHTGTLDPGAAGVLPIAVGYGTKCIEYVQQARKGYRTEIQLGIKSDTGDKFGAVTEGTDRIPPPRRIAEELQRFKGLIRQKPPMASSIKVSGKALYSYFRKGIEVEVPERQVEIYSVDIVKYHYPFLLLDIECSPGTYVRSICSDLGRALGCGALMSFLLRYRSGKFRLEKAHTFEALERAFLSGKTDGFLIPAFEALEDYPVVEVRTDQDKQKIGNGNYFTADHAWKSGQIVRIADERRNLLAIGKIPESPAGAVQPKKVFMQER